MKTKAIIFSVILSFILVSSVLAQTCFIPNTCTEDNSTKELDINSSTDNSSQCQFLIDLFNQKITDKNKEIDDLNAKIKSQNYIFIAIGILAVMLAIYLLIRRKNDKKKK